MHLDAATRRINARRGCAANASNARLPAPQAVRFAGDAVGRWASSAMTGRASASAGTIARGLIMWSMPSNLALEPILEESLEGAGADVREGDATNSRQATPMFI